MAQPDVSLVLVSSYLVDWIALMQVNIHPQVAMQNTNKPYIESLLPLGLDSLELGRENDPLTLPIEPSPTLSSLRQTITIFDSDPRHPSCTCTLNADWQLIDLTGYRFNVFSKGFPTKEVVGMEHRMDGPSHGIGYCLHHYQRRQTSTRKA